MSERFTLAYEKGNWWAVRDGDITLWKEEVIYLLNQQDQRITELEEENTHLCNFNLHNIFDKKNKEINQLKKELQSWKDTAEALQDQLAHHMEVVTDDYKAMQNL